MHQALLTNINGTLTTTASGEDFQLDPFDIKPVSGIEKALDHFKGRGFKIIGIGNQGGCEAINPQTGKPYKTIEDAIAQMKHTYKLLPQIDCIYICTNFAGTDVYRIGKFDIDLLNIPAGDGRKPGTGMINRARYDYSLDLEKSLMVGERVEDEGAARNAQIPFIWSRAFHLIF